MYSSTAMFLAGMPWNILMPVFLGGVGLGIYMAKRSSNKN